MVEKSTPAIEEAPVLSYRDELWLAGLGNPSSSGDSPSTSDDDGFNDVSLEGFGVTSPTLDEEDVTAVLNSLQVESDTESVLEVDKHDVVRNRQRAAADAETIGMDLAPITDQTNQQGILVPPDIIPAAPASLYSFVHMSSGTRHWCLDPFGRDWVCPVVERAGIAKYKHTTVPAINPHRQTCAVCIRMAKAIPEIDVEAWLGALPTCEKP
jgi:hypothetical protein